MSMWSSCEARFVAEVVHCLQAFKAFDADGDGHLSAEELRCSEDVCFLLLFARPTFSENSEIFWKAESSCCFSLFFLNSFICSSNMFNMFQTTCSRNISTSAFLPQGASGCSSYDGRLSSINMFSTWCNYFPIPRCQDMLMKDVRVRSRLD